MERSVLSQQTKNKKEAGDAKKSYSAPALEKGLDIIELLTTEERGLKLSEIASRLNRSVNEIFRMLAVLEQRSYIRMGESGDTYSLTLKIFELAHKISPVNQITAAATPWMQKLSREVNQSCHLAIYYQGKAVIVAQESSPADRGFNVRLGAEVDLIDSCSGHLLLAFASEGLRSKMLSERESIQKQSPAPSSLSRRLSKIHRQGYESMNSGQVKGITDVGYPIFGLSGEVVGTLSIPFLEHIDGSHSVGIEQASGLLKEVATSISQQLGYSEP